MALIQGWPLYIGNVKSSFSAKISKEMASGVDLNYTRGIDDCNGALTDDDETPHEVHVVPETSQSKSPYHNFWVNCLMLSIWLYSAMESD